MGITDSDVTDRLDIDSIQEALKSLFIDSCGPYELRTHPPLCTENPSPHRLPFPRGRKVVSRPDSGPEPGSRHIGDSETLWNTQRNCRRSSETEVVEMESCIRKSRAKGAVKKVKFVDLVIVLNYIQEEEYDGDNEDEKIKGKEEEEEEEEGNLIDIGRSFFDLGIH